MGRTTLVTYQGRIEVVGCFDNHTPPGTFDFYDFYEDGQCLNEGDPWYAGEGTATDTTPPSEDEVLAYLTSLGSFWEI